MSTNNKYLYTFEDVQKKAKEYGFEDSYMTDADWQLARVNPDAGMAIVGYKNDWLTATNDSAKAMAHAAAEDIRSRYGNYSGGGDGGSFTPMGTADYEDPWEQTIQSTVRNLQNRKFEWSPETDPTVKYYEDAYRREGERAMKDVLGAVASTTGGIPSSYATAAAAQQRNYYAQQMADKYPELYQQAFDRFMQEYDREYNMLSAYGDLSELGYGRWSDKQERDRNTRLDAVDKWYKEQDIGLRGRDLDITANQYGAQNEIAWAELGLQDKDMQQKYDLAYAQLNQDDRHFVDDLLYRYNVMTEEGKQFWAKLAEDGRIADEALQYQYDALSQEAQQFIKEYALEVSKFEAETEIAWAEIGLREDQFTQEMDYKYAALAQDDQQFVKDLLYKYDVMSEEGKQFWAKLAQDGKIADAELQYKYDALSEEAKQFVQEMAYQYDALSEEAKQFEQEMTYQYDVLDQEERHHQENLKLSQQEIQLQYAKLDEDKRQHIQNIAFDYYSLAQQADQWSAEQKLEAEQLGIERDKLNRSASLDQIEQAYAAAEFGDFSYLKKLGVNTDSYEALWNAQVGETLNPAEEEELPTEEDVVGAVGENIMKNPTYPSGYDLNAATIDSLAADAPGYKAKSDAENAAREQENRDNYGAKYAKYLNGETMSKSELKNLNDALERWIDAYRSGEDLTAEALAAVERYNNESVMKELFDRYRAGGQMLGVEESMMKHFVEDAYNRQRAGQKVTPIEQGILDIWLGGRKVKVGKYW